MNPQLAATAKGWPLGNEKPSDCVSATTAGGRSRATISFAEATIKVLVSARITIANASGRQRGRATIAHSRRDHVHDVLSAEAGDRSGDVVEPRGAMVDNPVDDRLVPWQCVETGERCEYDEQPGRDRDDPPCPGLQFPHRDRWPGMQAWTAGPVASASRTGVVGNLAHGSSGLCRMASSPTL